MQYVMVGWSRGLCRNYSPHISCSTQCLSPKDFFPIFYNFSFDLNRRWERVTVKCHDDDDDDDGDGDGDGDYNDDDDVNNNDNDNNNNNINNDDNDKDNDNNNNDNRDDGDSDNNNDSNGYDNYHYKDYDDKIISILIK